MPESRQRPHEAPRPGTATRRTLLSAAAAAAAATVKEIHAWSNRKPDISQRGAARPKETPPVPDYLDWDRWVGPAPMRPYHPS